MVGSYTTRICCQARSGRIFLIAGGTIAVTEGRMEWIKPQFTVVAVTMEVTAYAATK